MSWQPIETAPKDGSRILLSNGEWVCEARSQSREYDTEEFVRKEKDGGEICKRGKRTDYWWESLHDEVYAATHWMKLPEPPEGL